MATLDWQQRRTDGVTLVELLVTSERTCHVRIESTLTPVWPPRRQGVPDTGWTDNTFEGTIQDGGRLVLGFATPAEPTDPPAVLETEEEPSETVEPRDIVRALGDAAPPRDALPAPKLGETETTAVEREPTVGETVSTTPERSSSSTTDARNCEQPATCQQGTGPDLGVRAGARGRVPNNPDTNHFSDAAPAVLEAWFDEINSRLATAERLTSLESAEAASDAVERAGGLQAVEQLQAQLATDREQLEKLATRQESLTQRLDAVDIPVQALDRLT